MGCMASPSTVTVPLHALVRMTYFRYLRVVHVIVDILMGRAKLKMELISNQKSRNVTYQKRKKGLKKKAYELSTLCGVQCCVILYGPKLDDHPIELEIWPADERELLKMMSSYKNLSLDDRNKRTLDLSDFFEIRKRKAEDALMRMRKRNVEAMYPTWCDAFNHLSDEQLKELGGMLDTKIEGVRRMLLQMLIKANQEMAPSGMMEGLHTPTTQAHDSYFMHSLLMGRRMQVEVIQEEPISLINPFDQSQSLSLSQVGLPFDANWMTTLRSSPDHFSPLFFGASTSSNILCNGPACYNLATRLLDSVVVNNPRPPMCYNNPNVQPMAPYVQFPVMPSMHASEMEYCQVHMGNYKEN